MRRTLPLLVLLASFSPALAASPSPPRCREALRSCQDGCNLDYGASVRTRPQLARCLEACVREDGACQARLAPPVSGTKEDRPAVAPAVPASGHEEQVHVTPPPAAPAPVPQEEAPAPAPAARAEEVPAPAAPAAAPPAQEESEEEEEAPVPTAPAPPAPPAPAVKKPTDLSEWEPE